MIKKIVSKLSTLDGIENVSYIPEGGQSYAFSAFDSILNRKVFLKLYWYSEENKDSLLLEPRRLSSLYSSNENIKHHIVNLFSAEKIIIADDEYILLRMEFCEGESLYNRISTFGLSLHESINIAKKICHGLHFLHSVNIAHRDIKPGNIMMSDTNGKIIDLGSAILLDEATSSARVNSIKTLYYTPPETFAPIKSYNISSDIYQLGAVLHEMVNGKFKTPLSLNKKIIDRMENKFGKKNDEFDDYEKAELENANASYYASKNNLLIKLSLFREYIPRSLRNVIRTSTNSNIEKRYSNSIAFRAALSKLNIPNWSQVDEKNWTVTNWKNKDYRLGLVRIKHKNKFIFESSVSGKNKYRKNTKISNIKQAIKEING